MSDAWFSHDAERLFSLFSLLALFALVGPLAEQGRLKSVVMGLWMSAMTLAAGFLAAAGIAAYAGQPDYVARTLMLTGIVIGVTFAGVLPSLRRKYREAEMRKVAAADL